MFENLKIGFEFEFFISEKYHPEFFVPKNGMVTRPGKPLADYIDSLKSVYKIEDCFGEVFSISPQSFEKLSDAYLSSQMEGLSVGQYIQNNYCDFNSFFQEYSVLPIYGWSNEQHSHYLSSSCKIDPELSAEIKINIARELSKATGRFVVNNEFETSRQVCIFEDNSIEPDDVAQEDIPYLGLEITTPPLEYGEAIELKEIILNYARQTGLMTNLSTGLHVNLSFLGETSTIDKSKLLKTIQDEYWLKKFGREDNLYCSSITAACAYPYVRDIPHGNNFSINFLKLNYGYVEFRHCGGDYLNNEYFVDRYIEHCCTSFKNSAI